MLLLITSIWAIGALLFLWALKTSDNIQLQIAFETLPQLFYWLCLLWPLTIIITLTFPKR